MGSKPRKVVKVFVFILRFDGSPRLLVMDSEAIHGLYEVVRGKVDKTDPTLEFTARRETHEEAGIEHDAMTYLAEIGQNFWAPPNKPEAVEEQHALVFRAPDGLPDRFHHVVQSDAGDNGKLFHYHWLPITPNLVSMLAEGGEYFVSALIEWFNQYQP